MTNKKYLPMYFKDPQIILNIFILCFSIFLICPAIDNEKIHGFKCKTTILYNAYEYLTFSSMLLQNRPKFCTSFLLDCFDVLLHVSLMYVDIYSLQYFFPRKLVLRHARHYALQFAICISNLRIDE